MYLRCFTKTALVLLLLVPSPALANPEHAAAVSGDSARAQQSFTEAKAARDRGDVALALELFRESQESEASVGALVGIANCHEKQGEIASAWKMYTEAAQLAEQRRQSDRKALIMNEVQRLLPQLSYVQLTLAPGVEADALTLSVDGTHIDAPTWPLRLPLDGGEHELRITSSIYEPWVSKISLKNRSDFVELLVTLNPVPISPVLAAPTARAKGPPLPRYAAPSAREPQPSGVYLTPLQWTGAGIFGLGVASAGLCSFKTGQVLKYDARADAYCDDTRCSSAQGQNYADRVSEASDWATGYGLTAIGLLAVGASIVIWGGSPESRFNLGVAPNGLSASGKF